MFACAAFIEESRMKFVDVTKSNRKSRGMGHPLESLGNKDF
jgi:hypothetical protein